MKYPSEPQQERIIAMPKSTRKNRYSVGMVTMYEPQKGYGFLWSEQDGISYFFRIEEYMGEKEPERGDMVSFCAISSQSGPKAKEVRLIESGKLRDPALVGITFNWTGPEGKYAFAAHKEKGGDGTFIDKNCLVDRSSNIESNTLYKMDVAKAKKGYIGLNVRQLSTNEGVLIRKLAYDPNEHLYVRLKAFEILSKNEGGGEEFDAKMQEFAKSHPIPKPKRIKMKLPYIDFEKEGELDDRDVTVIKYVVIGGVVLGLAGLAVLLKSISSKGGSSSGGPISSSLGELNL
jgi:cold shock CspA family protein